MKTKNILFPLLLLVLMSSCEEWFNLNKTVKKEIFTGYVQKGPFINGSTLTISELDNYLNQTGRSYTTTIADNSGRFEQKQIELVSNYVQIKADGYYFNEVTGDLSASPLTLFALVDISDVNSANVNVLTHLEKSRVEYLIQNSGMTFHSAKLQAQSEVLAIFNMELSADSTSESLNFMNDGVDNAVLLAASAILQGTSSTADVAQLMADIISDIKTDGKLDNPSLGSTLLDNALLTNMTKVKQNLLARYAELGYNNVSIPDFEQYVNTFIENSTYTPEKRITYPATGASGINLLNDSVVKFKSSIGYSLTANLPEGTALKVVIRGTKGTWSYRAIPAPTNWLVGMFDNATLSQTFTVTKTGEANDCYIIFGNNADSVIVEYYENGSLTPTRTKTIISESLIPVDNSVYSYPYMGEIVKWENILNDTVKVVRGGKIYPMYALVPANKSLKVILKCDAKGWTENPSNPSQNWSFTEYNATTHSQEFNTTGTGKCEMSFHFDTSSKITIEMYENNATQPTKIKYLN